MNKSGKHEKLNKYLYLDKSKVLIYRRDEYKLINF